MGVEMKVHPVKVYREAGTGRAETRFIKATNGSVFPKKRKLIEFGTENRFLLHLEIQTLQACL
ncbi:hypothetical protein ES319_A05G247400v1 [Gossypium barbadense]|uniref:Uncharacterized protein n=1 Tax=Gossypium barbadense TaxID=3634 RepID=A0A5J5VUE7_GOSBA|nr:hypothetical protein ES319_A05G247400v1 [Gossypium barbadense]